MTFMDVKESGTLEVTDKPGRYRICIIKPGQGSSGKYTRENLAKSAHLFKIGTPIYIDHPSASEELDRPERSVVNMAGKLVTEAEIGEDGALYAEIMIYESVNKLVRERWQDIGMSINAWASATLDSDGVVPPLEGVHSVDLVTKAGAGGAILELIESAKPKAPEQKENKVDEKKFDDFAASVTEGLNKLSESIATALEAVTKLTESAAEEPKEEAPVEEPKEEVKPEAPAYGDVLKALAKVELPEEAVVRVIDAINAGKGIDEAIEAETKYIASAVEAATKAVPDTPVAPVKESTRVTGFARSVKGK